jgi:hypothetical protein
MRMSLWRGLKARAMFSCSFGWCICLTRMVPH